MTFDGDTLELVGDGDLNVVERNRLSTEDSGRWNRKIGESDGNSNESSESAAEFVLFDVHV